MTTDSLESCRQASAALTSALALYEKQINDFHSTMSKWTADSTFWENTTKKERIKQLESKINPKNTKGHYPTGETGCHGVSPARDNNFRNDCQTRYSNYVYNNNWTGCGWAGAAIGTCEISDDYLRRVNEENAEIRRQINALNDRDWAEESGIPKPVLGALELPNITVVCQDCGNNITTGDGKTTLQNIKQTNECIANVLSAANAVKPNTAPEAAKPNTTPEPSPTTTVSDPTTAPEDTKNQNKDVSTTLSRFEREENMGKFIGLGISFVMIVFFIVLILLALLSTV